MKEKISAKFENVMVIDDNRIDLYIASRMITHNNFGKKVMQYSSAIEALKYLQENQENIPELPEVILLDIYMPGMSGFEFMKKYDKLSTAIKKICRVFIISSSLDEQDLNRANNNKNIVAMKEKPLTKEFLIDLKQTIALYYSK
jgi:CheY-like chemotaxis protein